MRTLNDRLWNSAISSLQQWILHKAIGLPRSLEVFAGFYFIMGLNSICSIHNDNKWRQSSCTSMKPGPRKKSPCPPASPRSSLNSTSTESANKLPSPSYLHDSLDRSFREKVEIHQGCVVSERVIEEDNAPPFPFLLYLRMEHLCLFFKTYLFPELMVFFLGVWPI